VTGLGLSFQTVASRIGFELDRGFVAERRMQSASVIEVFDEGANVGATVTPYLKPLSEDMKAGVPSATPKKK
jgi:hypothetical protein